MKYKVSKKRYILTLKVQYIYSLKTEQNIASSTQCSLHPCINSRLGRNGIGVKMGIKYYTRIGNKCMRVCGAKSTYTAIPPKQKANITANSKTTRAKIECWFDGSCGPINPGGIMGCGCVIKKGKKYLLQEGFRISGDGFPVTTNNIAEHFALNNILRKLIKLKLQKKRIVVYGDSNLVIQQMLGNWRIKGGYYKETATDNLFLLRDFTNIAFKRIPRENNCEADELSIKYAPAFNEFI